MEIVKTGLAAAVLPVVFGISSNTFCFTLFPTRDGRDSRGSLAQLVRGDWSEVSPPKLSTLPTVEFNFEEVTIALVARFGSCIVRKYAYNFTDPAMKLLKIRVRRIRNINPNSVSLL